MNQAPVLVLQMQRMGDLVLSFPLLGRLAALFPGHPLWVVGEKAFYDPLLALSPQATYFGYEAAPGLEKQPFHLVVNVSHRPEAAALAGRLRSEAALGPLIDKRGRLFIRGDWQVYRASLTDNNRYNLFHWADLNCLDLCTPDLMRRTVWPPVRPPAPEAGEGARVGLFLGASQPEKHPDAAFWAGLCGRLLRAGRRPALLGGENEKALGQAVAERLAAPLLNLCGRFSVGELADFLGRLNLLITPDTGPMHVAAWLGVTCLNLSLGPVSAWETGPFAPGHYVLRAALNCAPCWRCTRERQFCREAMDEGAVAPAVNALLAGRAPRRAPPGLDLFRSRRDGLGLFDLEPLAPRLCPEREEHMLLSRFWQGFFAARFGYAGPEHAAQSAKELAAARPETAARLAVASAAFALSLARDARAGRFSLAEEADAWRAADPLFHPFSGYAQMYARNESCSASARSNLLQGAEELAALLGDR